MKKSDQCALCSTARTGMTYPLSQYHFTIVRHFPYDYEKNHITVRAFQDEDRLVIGFFLLRVGSYSLEPSL